MVSSRTETRKIQDELGGSILWCLKERMYLQNRKNDETLLGHGSLFRRSSNEQRWKNLNKRVTVVFDYNPKNKINIYVSILTQEFQLVMKELGKFLKNHH